MAGDEGEDGAVIRESFTKDYYANSSDDEAALLDEDDSPDAIGIRRGTRALRILRLVALTLFVAVAAVAIFQVHRYVNDVHTEQFEEYWHDQADHWMHNVFWPDLALKYQVAQSTATSLSHWHLIVTQQHEAFSATSANDTILLGQDMLRTQRLASAAVQVAWSPWITTEQERQELEQWAAAAMGHPPPPAQPDTSNEMNVMSNHPAPLEELESKERFIFRWDSQGVAEPETSPPVVLSCCTSNRTHKKKRSVRPICLVSPFCLLRYIFCIYSPILPFGWSPHCWGMVRLRKALVRTAH